jgi:ABC-type nitrate/sulfonate/bicarbonate transport system ATPase subunit
MTNLSVKDLSFAYGDLKLIDNLSFTISYNEIISLLGRSGCGKTTLFRLLAGLNKPTSGIIERRCTISYMTQNTLLLPWRTVLENLLLLSEIGSFSKKNKNDFKDKALFYLNEVGLKDVEDKYPSELSGGMQSRVALARVLLEDTDLILLDEPFAYLDAITRKECQTLLYELKNKFKKSMILVTHDISEAVFLSDRILILSEGKIKSSWYSSKDVQNNELLINQIHKSL